MSLYAILQDISQPIRNTFCPLCRWDGASFDCWEIYDVTQNKIEWTQLWHKKCQCARQPITTKPQHVDNERAGGESPIPGSQHNNEALWTFFGTAAAAFLCLLSSSEGSAMMSYFSAAWHSMTHSAPQMVFTVIQLVALSVAGQHFQANEILHTL